MEKLSPWIRELNEVGNPIRTRAEELDKQLSALLAQRSAFLQDVRALWSNQEIRHAKRDAKLEAGRRQRVLDLCKRPTSAETLAKELKIHNYAAELTCEQLRAEGKLRLQHTLGARYYETT